MSAPLTNLSFYHFVRLSNLEEWREALRSFCRARQLMGTILLAPEGINGGVTGSPIAVEELKTHLREKLSVREEEFKEATVSAHSFRRMLVKIKKQIITVGDTDVRPEETTGARLSAEELKKWMDEGKSFVLLDTRNRYEVQVGTFENALELGLETSGQFSQSISNLEESFKERPVVTFCTGGIRCEKASAVLIKQGFREVYQLDGGILRYFEKIGSDHFKGNCFVFDWRLAVDPELKPVSRSAESGSQFGRHQISKIEI